MPSPATVATTNAMKANRREPIRFIPSPRESGFWLTIIMRRGHERSIASAASRCPEDDGRRLAGRAAQRIHELGNLAALLGLVAAGDGVVDAIRHVIGEDFLLDRAQRGPHG